MLDPDARVREGPRVAVAVVAQRVELGRDDHRGREPDQVAVPRGQARVAGVHAGGTGVLGAEPEHRVGVEEVALGVVAEGVGVGAHLGDGVDQQLGGELVAAVAQVLGGDGGQVAAGGVAGHAGAVVAAELGGVLDHPVRGGHGVLDRRRERVLRREAVVEGDHHRATVLGDGAAGQVVGVEVADDEAAAVQEQHGRQWAVGVGPVDPRRSGPGRARHLGVGDLGHRGQQRVVAQVHGERAEPRAGLFGSLLRHRGRAGRGQELQQRAGGGVELGVQVGHRRVLLARSQPTASGSMAPWPATVAARSARWWSPSPSRWSRAVRTAV